MLIDLTPSSFFLPILVFLVYIFKIRMYTINKMPRKKKRKINCLNIFGTIVHFDKLFPRVRYTKF